MLVSLPGIVKSTGFEEVFFFLKLCAKLLQAANLMC